MNKMNKLIEKLEAATEGSRELDIEMAYGIPMGVSAEEDCAPHYTTSLDAALTLVPEGAYTKLQIGRNQERTYAWVEMEDREAVVCSKTPALAICIAALKAKE